MQRGRFQDLIGRQDLISRSTAIVAVCAGAMFCLLIAQSRIMADIPALLRPAAVWPGLLWPSLLWPGLIWPAAIAMIMLVALRWFRIVPRRELDRFVAGAEEQAARFDTALNNMSQGLCFFDGQRRLIVCNRRYSELYDLSPECARPGTSLETIVDHRFAVGAFPEMTREEYLVWRELVVIAAEPSDTVVRLRNGRVIAIHHRPMPDGGWVATHEDITARHVAEARIEHLAGHDALTGLANRMRLRTHLKEVGCHLPHVPAAILMLDLDRFKAVNDCFGHAVGDGLLCAVAERLRCSVRETDLVVRLGGDEFAIVQTHCDQPTQAESLARRIVARIDEPFEVAGHTLSVAASIGIAVLGRESGAVDEVLNDADIAMYQAKNASRGLAAGCGRYVLFQPEMVEGLQARRTLEAELRRAIVNAEFELFYQPITNAQSGEVIACEALLRWRHPVRGLVLPGEFIAVAEEIGLMVAIGEWVLLQACRDAADWPGDVRVTVNLSSGQFVDAGLVAAVAAALAQSGLAPARLELEITEAMLCHGARRVLRKLSAVGVHISLDRFGARNSSFNHLRHFRFSRLKIDRSFVRGMAAGGPAANSAAANGAMVSAMIALGRELGVTITADGVETQAESDILRALGCTELQGFHFGRPVRGREIAATLVRAALQTTDPRLVTAA